MRASPLPVGDVPVRDGQAAGVGEELGGVGEQLLPELLPHLLDGLAGDVGLAGGVGPGVKGGGVGVLEGDDVHVLGGDADGLGGHLGEHRVAPLADLGGPQLELHRAVLVEHHAGGGGLQGDGVHAGLVGEAGHAHPPAHRAGLVLVLLPQLLPADVRRALVDALRQAGGVAGDAVEGVHIAQGHDVLLRNSRGSSPISRAMSSIMHSEAKLHWGMP